MADEDLASKDWARLGDYIKRRRHDELHLSQDTLAQRADVSTAAIQYWEAGRVPRAWPRKLSRVVAALGWTEASIDAILEGGEPTHRKESEDRGSDLVFILQYIHEASPGTHVAIRAVLEQDLNVRERLRQERLRVDRPETGEERGS